MALSYPHQKYTMFERARALDGDGKSLEVVEVLNQRTDDFLKDMVTKQASNGLFERTRIRMSIPTPTYGQFYRGVANNSTTTRFVNNPVCEITDRSEIDVREFDTMQNGGGKIERTNVVKAFLEGMGQKIVDLNINGGEDGTTGQHVSGMLDHLNTLQVGGVNRRNVIDAGGSSNRTAIILCEWGPQGWYGFYPPGFMKNTLNGVDYRNRGVEKVFDGDNNPYYAYVDTFSAWLGTAIADELKLAAVVNVDSTAAFNEDNIIKLLNRCKFNRNMTRIYMNEIMAGQVEIRANSKGNIIWGTNELFGKPVTTMSGGAVLRTVDSQILTNSMAAVA